MLKGKGISSGIGIGKARLLKKEQLKIEKKKIENTQKELEKFRQALEKVKESTDRTLRNLPKDSEEQIKILEAYLMILEDKELIKETEKLIIENKFNSEYATEIGFNNIIEIFEKMEDTYMAERAADIRDIKNRIISNILGVSKIDLTNIPENTIIVAKELTTSDTAKLNIQNVAGIISEIGGTNSHVSIMARTKEIPAVIRIEKVFEEIQDDDTIIINGQTGEVIVNPSIEEITEYQEMKNREQKEKIELEAYKDKKILLDNKKALEISCNIGNLSDLEDAVNVGADGIGLFRTEFLFMDTPKMPTEDEQFLTYKKVAETMKDKLSIIRTLDAGGDKNIEYLNLEKEDNPFLGYRAIRICLEDVELFKIQLRAILRASSFGNLAIMFPMISSVEELRKAKNILQECKQELMAKNIDFKEDIKVGIMIEIPAAAIMAEELAKECDFFSIGTNDLIQYTVAVERGNSKIAKLYTKNHPAVIKLIKLTIDGAHKAGIFCGMCGEAASNLQYIPLLIGLGLDEFSMNASSILKSKKVISNLSVNECIDLANRILSLSSTEEVENELLKF